MTAAWAHSPYGGAALFGVAFAESSFYSNSASAGAFGLDFKRYLLATFVGRGGRFFLVGLVIALFGDPVKVLLEAYFEVAVVAFAVLLIGGIYVVDLLGWRSSGWQAPNSHSGSHKPPGDASGAPNEELERGSDVSQ